MSWTWLSLEDVWPWPLTCCPPGIHTWLHCERKSAKHWTYIS